MADQQENGHENKRGVTGGGVFRMLINTDLDRRVVMGSADMDWMTSPLPGVTRRMLERDGEDGSRRATSVVRYAP